jgi:hypothetical protein
VNDFFDLLTVVTEYLAVANKPSNYLAPAIILQVFFVHILLTTTKRLLNCPMPLFFDPLPFDTVNIFVFACLVFIFLPIKYHHHHRLFISSSSSFLGAVTLVSF